MSKKISNNIKNFWFTREVASMACGRQKKKPTKPRGSKLIALCI